MNKKNWHTVEGGRGEDNNNKERDGEDTIFL